MSQINNTKTCGCCLSIFVLFAFAILGIYYNSLALGIGIGFFISVVISILAFRNTSKSTSTQGSSYTGNAEYEQWKQKALAENEVFKTSGPVQNTISSTTKNETPQTIDFTDYDLPRQNTNIIIREIVKIRCPYCGKLYDEHSNSCPNCGASR